MGARLILAQDEGVEICVAIHTLGTLCSGTMALSSICSAFSSVRQTALSYLSLPLFALVLFNLIYDLVAIALAMIAGSSDSTHTQKMFKLV